MAWHERQVMGHVEQLAHVRDQGGAFVDQLEGVLETCARMSGQGQGTGLAELLHRGAHVDRAQHHVAGMIAELLREGVAAGEVRGDVEPGELARFCLHGLTAAAGLDEAGVRRLVQLVLAALRPLR